MDEEHEDHADGQADDEGPLDTPTDPDIPTDPDNTDGDNDPPPDASPVEDSGPLTPSGGGSASPSLPVEPKQKLSWLGKLKNVIAGDGDIQNLHEAQDQDDAEHARRKAERETEQARIESNHASRLRRMNPAFKAEQKRVDMAYKAETLEARRMAKWIEMVDEAIRRKAPDPELVEWCRSQIGNHHMSGFFSSPPE